MRIARENARLNGCAALVECVRAAGLSARTVSRARAVRSGVRQYPAWAADAAGPPDAARARAGRARGSVRIARGPGERRARRLPAARAALVRRIPLGEWVTLVLLEPHPVKWRCRHLCGMHAIRQREDHHASADERPHSRGPCGRPRASDAGASRSRASPGASAPRSAHRRSGRAGPSSRGAARLAAIGVERRNVAVVMVSLLMFENARKTPLNWSCVLALQHRYRRSTLVAGSAAWELRETRINTSLFGKNSITRRDESAAAAKVHVAVHKIESRTPVFMAARRAGAVAAPQTRSIDCRHVRSPLPDVRGSRRTRGERGPARGAARRVEAARARRLHRPARRPPSERIRAAAPRSGSPGSPASPARPAPRSCSPTAP